MFQQHHDIILASASPRRQQYLEELGISFSVHPAEIDETPLQLEKPRQYVRRMARNKMEQISDLFPSSCVISADTIVFLEDTMFGKPRDETQALETLKLLNGKTHSVITGVCINSPPESFRIFFDEETKVTFGQFSDDLLYRYIKTKDPFDKAGGYGIQSFGGFLIKSIEGSYSNVVGLPVSKLITTLLQGKIIY